MVYCCFDWFVGVRLTLENFGVSNCPGVVPLSHLSVINIYPQSTIEQSCTTRDVMCINDHLSVCLRTCGSSIFPVRLQTNQVRTRIFIAECVYNLIICPCVCEPVVHRYSACDFKTSSYKNPHCRTFINMCETRSSLLRIHCKINAKLPNWCTKSVCVHECLLKRMYARSEGANVNCAAGRVSRIIVWFSWYIRRITRTPYQYVWCVQISMLWKVTKRIIS
jgi:hypothetical protein